MRDARSSRPGVVRDARSSRPDRGRWLRRALPGELRSRTVVRDARRATLQQNAIDSRTERDDIGGAT